MRDSLVLTVLLACGAAFAQERPRAEHVESYFGDVVLRTDGARVIVMLDTNLDATTASDGLIDQWFLLQTAEPPLVPVQAHLRDALVVHTPRALRVSTSDHRYELVIDSPDTPVAPMATRIAGVGLAHHKAATGVRITDQLDRRGRVTATCEGCFYEDPFPGGGSNSGSCTSGGRGSTSCSASYGTTSCSVACASGYYACCNAVPGAAYCRCIQG